MFDKFIIFLPNILSVIKIDASCMCSKKNKRSPIISYFENRGIEVKFKKDIKNIINEKKRKFDDKVFPELNKLYIHLFNGDYYSDDLYTSKKNDRERELLFLLAIKLGVRSINYETIIEETVLSGIKVSANTGDINLGTTFKKSIKKYKGETGKEMYHNRGAPIYVLSDTLEQVEQNINERFSKLNSSIFSYDFYKNNDNLRLFVYKRFNFKTASIEYTTDYEDNVDLVFDVKLKLMKFGLGVKFDKQIILNERMIYKLEFFSDKELRLSLSNELRISQDQFATIREIYDNHEKKETAIYHITEYVRKYSKKCNITFNNETNGERISENYRNRLIKWINNNGQEKFKEACREFTSSYQIRTWFRENLIYENETIIEDDDENDSDIEEYGILRLKKTINSNLKENLLKTGNYQLSCMKLNTDINLNKRICQIKLPESKTSRICIFKKFKRKKTNEEKEELSYTSSSETDCELFDIKGHNTKCYNKINENFVEIKKKNKKNRKVNYNINSK